MHFVGVDLAWGTQNPTGVAALDDRGRLLGVSTVRTDAEVTAEVARYATGDCAVGIDAPLVVTNPTGARPCETALSRDFRPFEAGAHPANTSRPVFADGTRGGRLAAALDLSLELPPAGTTSGRWALEVYPHAATIALFRLGRTLKYKQKQGRSFPQLRAELLRLVELLESLSRARTPLLLARREPWERLVAGVRDATRKSDLRVVEDQVDAVLCAYVALHALREPEHTTVYGDPARVATDGCIVTPTLPPDLEPTPRPTRAERSRDAAVEAYAGGLAGLRTATAGYLGLVTSILDDAGINYLSVEARTKSVDSFAAKAVSELPVGSGTPRYSDPLAEMADQVGLRVVTYLTSDVEAVADLLSEELAVLGDRDKGQETARQGRFGYASRHLDLTLDEARAAASRAGTAFPEMAGRQVEVQVRTVLQHAWAEFEHEIRYKGSVPADRASDLDRRFTLAAGLLELADREFTTIRDDLRTEAGSTGSDAEAMGARDLAAYLAGRYPGAGWSRTEHYEWMTGLLAELGLRSPADLGAALADVDSGAVTARMSYRYPAGAVRRLDDDLLAAYGEAYVALPGNAHRTQLLTERAARMAPGSA